MVALCMVAGKLIGSVLVDLIVPGHVLGPAGVLATGIALAAVLIATIPGCRGG